MNIPISSLSFENDFIFGSLFKSTLEMSVLMKIGDKVIYKSREYKIIYIYRNDLKAELLSFDAKHEKFELAHISHLIKTNPTYVENLQMGSPYENC